ncbi:MAG: hypothetical protein MJZ91_05965 [Bacteroidales bacterium]|nr:hypothetical protein [Bacteroidales bacterium]
MAGTLFFACCGGEGARQPEEHGSSAHAILAEIDSLMWRRADSAFVLLQEFVVSPEVEELDTFDGHYCQVLISELLYKNDCEQTNREDLLQAVVYFDSLIVNQHDANKREVVIQKQNVFLDARAHYINGVGHYEQGNVVQACAEYLKALELMEEHFEEKDLVGKKAQFMTYIYNRLGDMFEEQLLAEPAITCYKQALFYCRREPTSKYGLSVLLYRLGIQYDIVNQKDSAAFYYDEALANMPDFDNLHYRDLVSNKAIFAFFNLEYSSDSVIKILKQLVTLSADEEERTTRLLTLGNILFEDKQYDSSRVYLETLFEQQEKDITSQLMAAESLNSIYQMKGDSVKAQKYALFLAGFTMSEIEKKTEVSKVNEMFKEHLTKQQEKQAGLAREKAVKKTLEIIIPIAVVVALVIFIVLKHRSKKLLKEHQEEAGRMLGETERQHKDELRRRQVEAEKQLEDKEKHYQSELETKEAEARKEMEEKDKQHAEVLEAERQTHRMEQAAMSGRLKRSNQELRELKDQIKQLDDMAAKTEVAASFDEEPICHLIMDRVNEGQFKSKIDYIIYKDAALEKQQLLDLRLAVDRHFGQFTARLKKAYPELTNSDLDYCCLYLLGLTDADIAALMQRTYNTVFERKSKMRKIFGSDNPLPITLMGMANDSLFI